MCQLIKPKEEIFHRFLLLLKREQLPSQPHPLVPVSYESMDFFMLLEGLLAFPFCTCQPHSSKSRVEFGVIRVVLGRISSLGCSVLGQCWPWVGRLALPFGPAAGEHWGAGVWCLARFLSHTCATESGVPWQPGHAPVGSVMGTHCCRWFSLKTVQMTPSHLALYVGCSLIVTISSCSPAHISCASQAFL